MYLAPGITQLFGAACFFFGLLMLLAHRNILGKFRVLFVPFSVSSIAFFMYFLRNVIEIPYPLDLIGNVFTFLMWGSWLWSVLSILRIVERKKEISR
jgi:hydrogenase-4 membrane subunit HyfE